MFHFECFQDEHRERTDVRMNGIKSETQNALQLNGDAGQSAAGSDVTGDDKKVNQKQLFELSLVRVVGISEKK